MRIITGSARGRRLETLSGEETRPTSEKVKEALFSAIQFDIEGRRVLDLKPSAAAHRGACLWIATRRRWRSSAAISRPRG